MRKYIQSLLLMLGLLATPVVATAQGGGQAIVSTASISTSGADCSTATACAIFGIREYPSLGVYINVATSGTFVFEATTGADTTGTWFAINDDVGGVGSATADGYVTFSNPGYTYIRIRASAINGTASLAAARGFTGLRSTASLSGAAQGDGAIQDGTNPAIEMTVFDFTNSNPAAVHIVDANGDAAVIGGGTEYDHGQAVTLGSANGSAVGGRSSATAPTTVGVVDDDFVVQWMRSTGEQVVGGSGTAGTASANVLTVQGIASMTPLLVGDGTGSFNVIVDSGTITVTDGAGALNTIVDSGTITTVSTVTSVTQNADVRQATAGNLNATVVGTGTFATQAAQSGNWTVRLADGAGTALTSGTAGATQSLHMHVVDSSGNIVSSFGGSGGTASAFGSTFPSGASSGTAIGGYDGTNMQGFRVVDSDTSGGSFWTMATNAVFRTSGTPVEAGTSSNPWNVVFPSAQSVTASNLDVQSGGADLVAEATFLAAFGTAGTADSQVLSVQGVASMTPLLVTASAGTNLNTSALLTSTNFSDAFGTAGSADTQVMSVQGISGGTALVVGDGSGALNVIIDSGTVTTVSTVTSVSQWAGTAIPLVTATLADDLANTQDGLATVSLAYVYDGSTWDRLRGDATNGVLVNMGGNNDVINLGTFAVQVDGAALTALQLIDNIVSAEDAVAGSGWSGVGMLAVRQDSQSALAADGDFIPLTIDSAGGLRVTVVGGSVSAGGIADDADFVAGTTVFQPVGGFYQSTVTACTDGDACTVGITAQRAVKTTLYTEAGVAVSFGTDYTFDAALTTATTAGPMLMGRASAAAPTNVTADDDAVMGWFLRNGSQVVNLAAGGTLITSTSSSLNVACTTGCSGGTQYNEDDAHASGNALTMAGTVRQDTKGTGLGANGDNANLYVNSSGELYTTPAGQVAQDAAAASINPVLVGAYASQAAPSDVSADNDAVRLWALRNGSQVVNLAAGGTLITSTSSSLNANVTNTVTVTDGSGSMNVIVDSGTVTTVSTVTSLSQLGGVALPIEDAGETAAGVGIYAMSVRRDTAASSAGTTGDNATINTDATGRLWVNPSTIGVEDVGETAAGDLNMIGTVRRDTAASSAGTTGDNATLNTDALGKLWVSGAYAEDSAHGSTDLGLAVFGRRIDTLAASSGSTGDYETFNMAADGALYTANVGATNGGGVFSGVTSAASTNSTSVKASAGQVYGIYLVNTTATLYYLRLYNLSSAPTCSSATGYVATIPVPASTTGAGVSMPLPIGGAFATGIGYCITGGPTSTDNTNAAVGIYGTIIYK